MQSEDKPASPPAAIDTDVCIYGATPSGIMAAIAVKREGRSVVIVEPSRWVGGILGAGIKPIQDCPNFGAIGGTTRQVMKRLGLRNVEGEVTPKVLRRAMMSISPATLRDDFLALLRENEIEVVYDHRVQRIVKDGPRITTALFDHAPFDDRGRPVAEPLAYEALAVTAKVFIDAGYDGEMMARAGVSFMTGRESSAAYGEERAGVREPVLLTPIDPYVVPGDNTSGLLPMIESDHGRPVGSDDYYTQAYNFRFYVTDNPQFRAPFQVPDDYSPGQYELVGRYVEYLVATIPDYDELRAALRGIFPGWLNAGEYNYQRNSLITMAPVGVSHVYVTGDYGTKARVWKYHQDYLCGLHQFLSTDARVPEAFRKETASLGLDIRHHPDTHGWPHQLYIRVSRRMVGEYTVSAADVYNKTEIDDPIALAQYGIDTYPSRRIVVEKDGNVFVAAEGNMFIGGDKGPTNTPYPISYRSITPKRQECQNLLVPVCFSATHLGYASARMEPVFMMCGESAGIAAVQMLVQGVAAQDIDKATYLKALKDAGQFLKWPTGFVDVR